MAETWAEISQGSDAFRPAAPIPHGRNLSALQFILELGRNPIAAFGARAYRERYVFERSRIRDFFMICDPGGAKHVLLDNAANYVKSSQAQRQLKPALGNGLVTAEGASWRFQRRTASPMFQHRHIAALAPQMADATEVMLARWRAHPPETEIDVADEMTRLTYDIISRTMFSNDVTMDYEAMSHALASYFENVGRVDLAGALGVPDWVPTPRRLRARPALRFFRREMGSLIARRRALIDSDPLSAPQDLLTLLLTARDPEGGALFGDEEVYDNVLTFIFAGHETTANALAWALYLLSQSPRWNARVADEAGTVLDGRNPGANDIDALTVTRAVLEETMRLYPPAPLIARDAAGPDTIGGIAIDKGTFVLLPIWIMHRHQTLWDKPDQFDPQRFSPERRQQIHRFAYMPFGGGPRGCIGMGFAMTEATIILSMIAREFTLALKQGHPVEPLARITLRPRYGLRMVLRKRSSGDAAWPPQDDASRTASP
jgi:cytochrome P450